MKFWILKLPGLGTQNAHKGTVQTENTAPYKMMMIKNPLFYSALAKFPK